MGNDEPDIPAGQAVRILEARLAALDRLVHVQLEAHRNEMASAIDANQTRIQNIYTSLDRIRDGLNQTLSQDEYDRRHDSLEKRIGLLELGQSQGRGVIAGVSITLGLLIGGFVALALHLFG